MEAEVREDDERIKPVNEMSGSNKAVMSSAAVPHNPNHILQNNEEADSKPTTNDEGSESDDDDNEDANADDNDNDDDDQDNSESDDSEPVESLLQGRERRSNQGNRYAGLLQQETINDDTDEQFNEIFQEGGDEDIDFEESDESDAPQKEDDEVDDSSSDDEDQGPTAEEGDLEGEKQLQKEERAAKRVEKRKADRAFTKIPTVRKKVKIDDSATPDSNKTAEPAERKRKMSERISWLPTGPPARTSSRTLSVQNKQRTMASMKENEEKRMKQIALMEAAQKRKAEKKAKPMTQAERMADAARTEELNSKSLTKWEEMEEEKIRKQRARLEAMHNRKIDGPFIRWYSGKAEWINGKLRSHGKSAVTEIVHMHQEHNDSETPVEPKKKPGRKPKLKPPVADIEDPSTPKHAKWTIDSDAKAAVSGDGTSTATTPLPDPDALEESKEESLSVDASAEPSTAIDEKNIEEQKDGEVTDEHQPSDTLGETPGKTLGNTKWGQRVEEDVESPNEASEVVAETTSPFEESTSNTVATPMAEDTVANVDEETPNATENEVASTPNNAEAATQVQTANPELSLTEKSSQQPKLELAEAVEHTTRNVVTLENYEESAISDPIVRRSVIFGTPLPTNYAPFAHITMRSMRPPKVSPSVCVVTKQPAKYRDPATGLPYSSVSAYKAIQKVVDGSCVWSDLLGAWAGGNEKATNGGAASGVPEGFFSGVLPDQASVENDTTAETVVKTENVT